MSIIIFNTLMMATEFDPPDQIFTMISSYIGYLFLTIYCVETVAKIVAFGVISWSDEVCQVLCLVFKVQGSGFRV